MTIPVRREGKAGQDVLVGQIVEVIQNLLLCHTRREIPKDIIDSDSLAPDARLAAPFPGFNGDNLLVAHLYAALHALLVVKPIL